MMRDGSMPAATRASSNVDRSSADIEFASLLVPNTASPQFCESNHWQCLMNRCRSGERSALNGVTTGASTPRMRWLGGEIVVSGIAKRKPKVGILERSAAENSPQRTRRSATDYIVVATHLWRACIITERASQTAHSGVATGYAGDRPVATVSVKPYFLSKSDTYAP